ncbi:MAG: protein-S-isoprenylcysteine methyltransferase [Rhizobacter sp.]|jgi:protein-S-isoprenylcysteine O-methyltransferase Ste14|nr:protein-S-isoprenylcysteine methyltransferase [Rhizobacter sp.]
MNSLELKVPPPVVAAVIALAMWLVSSMTPPFDAPHWLRILLAVAIALIGGAFSIAGARAFRKARTTVNPMKPDAATSLVSSGVYRITRNPMYVGLLILLVGWSVFLSSVWALIGPLAFFVYIDRLQIVPEERALARLFGDEYAAYKTRVRRWL